MSAGTPASAEQVMSTGHAYYEQHSTTIAPQRQIIQPLYQASTGNVYAWKVTYSSTTVVQVSTVQLQLAQANLSNFTAIVRPSTSCPWRSWKQSTNPSPCTSFHMTSCELCARQLYHRKSGHVQLDMNGQLGQPRTTMEANIAWTCNTCGFCCMNTNESTRFYTANSVF